MGRLTRAGTITIIALAVQPPMLILGFYAVFPDFLRYLYLYIALLFAVSIVAGSMITKGIDVFIAAIISATVYLIIFRSLLALLITPYLYQGYEAYSLLSTLFLPGFFYFFVFLFVEVLSLFIGSLIRTFRV